jgi:hypothetical protein
MAERTTPSKGGKPDKLIRDALMLALKREHLADGVVTSKINAIAAKLVDIAINGNVQAAALIADRVDGKAMQAVEVTHDGEVTFRSAAISALDEIIAGAAAGSADRARKDSLPN